jgi:O-antigen/teichoic acid export membrane protein|tara:strand:+ start:1135 stop:2772 length:1638 start_codon:yes stop_codon:yes gene_type:complete
MNKELHEISNQPLVDQGSGETWHIAEYQKLTAKSQEAVDHLCRAGETTLDDLAEHLGITPGRAGRLLHGAIQEHLVKERFTDDGKVIVSPGHLIATLHSAVAEKTPQSISELKSELLSGATRYVAVRSGAIFLAYLSQIFLVHWLGTEDYGYYSIATTVAILLSMLASLGFPLSMGRFLPQYVGTKDWGHFKGFSNYAARLSLVASVLLCAIAFPFVSFTGMKPAEVHVMWLALILVPILAYGDVIGSVLLAQKFWIQNFLPKMILVPGLLLAFAWFMHQEWGDLSATHMIIGFLVASSLSVGLQWALNQIKQTKEVSNAKKEDDQKSTWLHTSLPMLAMMLFGVIVNRADLILVGIIAGHRAAGIYAVVLFTAETIQIFKTAGKTVVGPLIAPLFKKDGRESIQRLGGFLSRLAFSLAVVGAALIAFFGHQLLGIFGKEFTAGYQALMVLLVMQLLRAASGVPGMLLIMTGKQTRLVKVYSLSVVAQLALLAALVPTLGILGAAIATTITEMVSIYTISWTARKATGLSTGLFANAHATPLPKS